MKIEALKCEYAVNPLGIEVQRPRLSWRMQTDRNGARQTAYQILVASQLDGLENADLFNSGRVESNQSAQVVYCGQALKSRQRAWWQVRVWDETGEVTCSEVAWWENGLLDASDWRGQWIGGDLQGGHLTAVPAPFLRRPFVVEKPIKAARLYATALGIYECEINGRKVGDQVFAPGWTDYKQRLHYQTYDVTDLLQDGENCWGAVLGDGWYCGHIEQRGRGRYGDKPAFFGQLEFEFEDGSRQFMASDKSFCFAYGPILEADLLMGESFDARLDFPGWSAPGFDATEWREVAIVATPTAKLCAPLGPPVRATLELAPVGEPQVLETWSARTLIFDMGQNMVGRVRIRVCGPRGSTLRLRFAEVLQGGPAATIGPIYTENLRTAQQTDCYTLRGEGEEVWESRFTQHGFRFVEVTLARNTPIELSLTGVVLHSDTPKIGDFSCSDALLTQLQKNIDWGQRGNFVDVPTDCPQRDERVGWTGDAQVFVRTACFNRDVASFFEEWARDMADAQLADGGIPSVVPDTTRLGSYLASPDEQGYDGGPAWADAVLICPWTIYRCYGDTRVLQDNYPVFERYLNYLTSTARNGIRCFEGASYHRGFGDWLALDGSGEVAGGTPRDLIGTAFYAHAADLMSRIARVLHKTADAARYGALFVEVKSVFNRRFVTPDGRLSPSLQTPYLLALQFDLLPKSQRANAARELVQEVRNRHTNLSTGFVGSPYINHVLTQTGHLDVAYELLYKKVWPSWLYAVTQGATTIWERWNGWTPEHSFEDAGMNSFNHYAYGAIGDWLYQVVAGIRLDDEVAGYQKFVLQPQPDPQAASLSWVRAHLDTVYGRIESSWRLEGGEFCWDFTVPPNTTARVVPPAGEAFKASAGRHQWSRVMRGHRESPTILRSRR